MSAWDENRGKIKMNILPRFTCHHRTCTAGGVDCCDLHVYTHDLNIFLFRFHIYDVHTSYSCNCINVATNIIYM